MQLYASVCRRGVTRPVQELVGFRRAPHSNPANEAIMTFALESAILGCYDVDWTWS